MTTRNSFEKPFQNPYSLWRRQTICVRDCVGRTREQIAEVALGRPLNAFDRSVDVHVSRLRKKLSGCPVPVDELIRPIRGVGYFLSATETPEKTKV